LLNPVFFEWGEEPDRLPTPFTWPYSRAPSVASWQYCGVDSLSAISITLRSLVARTKQGPFPRAGLCCPRPSNGTIWTPPTPDAARCDFVALYASVDAPLASRYRVSSTGPVISRCMPPLLPREKTPAASVLSARVLRPSPADKRVGFSNSSDEATCRFTCVTACRFAVWELTTPDRSDAAPACYPGVRTTPGTGL